MPWARLDDKFPRHRKVKRLPDPAFRLHVSAICWCAEHLTDGFVPDDELDDVSEVRQPAKHAAVLVDRGLWHAVPGGWLIHDYLDYNPTSDQVKAERQRAAERQRRARDAARAKRDAEEAARHAGSHAVTAPVSHAGSHGSPVPTRPDPSPSCGSERGEVEVDVRARGARPLRLAVGS